MSAITYSLYASTRSAVSVLALGLALSACSAEQQAAKPDTVTSSSSVASNYTGSTYVASRAITAGSWPADVPVSCDYLNPDAIKNLTPETIQWLAEIFPNGLTRHEHFIVVRDTGYTGEIGQGGHSAFMQAVPGRVESFERMTSAFANQSMLPTWNTFREHHVQVRSTGYQGLFLCGGHNCWIAGGCDNLGRRK